MRVQSRRIGFLALTLAALMLAGCARTLVFGTGTKFGLDVSQRADQTVEISMGYDRIEYASIPAPREQANKTEDTYSVLGYFTVSYGNPFSRKPLVLRQFFSTGWAARAAAEDENLQEYFATKAARIQED